jgi:hypothetical protein
MMIILIQTMPKIKFKTIKQIVIKALWFPHFHNKRKFKTKRNLIFQLEYGRLVF